jgi:hypothetical protein
MGLLADMIERLASLVLSFFKMTAQKLRALCSVYKIK